jgi:hypothetical protein
MMLLLLLGCKEEATEAQTTGVEITFVNCLTFNAQIFIDDSYKGSYSSERPAIIELAAGSHTLWAKSNLSVNEPDTSFCWTESFSVSDGSVTRLLLDCEGHGCSSDE